ncbi:uncharacterized protein LOC119648176 isoform X2 [Hermetia illucens]|uniref:uncharacterized protein LOC119648176 isoform X2 n=1 Tax=Hermetia illucens TaxID=343691 RepID=UPI0018CBFCDC|nr:uncharacterized protein LOC119648176 isoform X2 [Hermetia illucens]
MTVIKDASGFRLQFDEQIPEDERRFYLKVYPTVNVVSDRKVHCTVCGVHIGTAPANESVIRMHPILKVTHCKKCHEFYNSGEFSKGEDGSELYCRWCGQGGEVYCCSKCPYVFCTNCIVQNLSKDCVNDIEENENWNCFVCAPKIMWHLRAQHWALMNFIEKQKQEILDKNLTESAIRKLMTRDLCTCCKPKGGNISDSSCDSESSMSRKRKAASQLEKVEKKIQLPRKILPKVEEDAPPEPKKAKPNDEVVCTPDVLSLIDQTSSATSTLPNAHHNISGTPDRQRPILSQSQQAVYPPARPTPTLQTPSPVGVTPLSTCSPMAPLQIVHSQSMQVTSSQAPPLAIRAVSSPGQLRGLSPTVMGRKTIIGNRPPTATPGQSPVYHTINGFRIDLNTAAQQETFRLPNGKLIQVKRQGTTAGSVNLPSVAVSSSQGTFPINISQPNPISRPPQLAQLQQQPARGIQTNGTAILSAQAPQIPQPVQQFTIQPPPMATIRYAPATGQFIGANGAPIQAPQANVLNQVNNMMNGGNPITAVAIRPTAQTPSLVKHVFASTPLGQARTQLQNQIFASMEICQHLIGKIHTLTNSNAYKTAKNYTDVKELYIHLSYLFTYAIGRFKTLQEKCMDDMRCLGFAGDAATLESGQLEKYASDNDEDDIVIVEPKTTLIDLDSDEDDDQQGSKNNKKTSPPARPAAPSPAAAKPMQAVQQIQQQQLQQKQQMQQQQEQQLLQHQQVQQQQQNQQRNTPPLVYPSSKPPPLLIKPTGTVVPPFGMMTPASRQIAAPPRPQSQPVLATESTTPQAVPSPTPSLAPVESLECDLDFTANLLAGMLDVELHEGSEAVQIAAPPKKPRKKTTNKPNPHLIKQQQIQARERERERIKHDAKLNTKCLIPLERIEETDNQAKKLLQEFIENSPESSPVNGVDSSLDSADAMNQDQGDQVNTETSTLNGTEVDPTEDEKTINVEKTNGEASSSEIEAEVGKPTESINIEDDKPKEVDPEASKDPIQIDNNDTPMPPEDTADTAPPVETTAAASTSEIAPNPPDDTAKGNETNAPKDKIQTQEGNSNESTTPPDDTANILKELSNLISPGEDDNEQIELLEVIDPVDEELFDLPPEETTPTNGEAAGSNPLTPAASVSEAKVPEDQSQNMEVDSTTKNDLLELASKEADVIDEIAKALEGVAN